MKILIAEDCAVTRTLLSSLGKRLGHEITAVENGRAAWLAYQREDFSLLITDWMMPEVNGLELCRMIRSENRAKYTYIILLTLLGGKGSFLEGMKAGVDDFITKPFDQEQLSARLRVAERIVNLQKEVKQLQELLPICSYCKNIRDDENQWMEIDKYIASHTDTNFSHGVCADCYAKWLQPELDLMKCRGAVSAHS